MAILNEESMLCMNRIKKEDALYVSNQNCIDWSVLNKKNILVTGATGLIGSSIINSLAIANEQRKLGIKIFALVRNQEKAKRILPSSNDIIVISSPVESFNEIEERIDFVIHAASPTSSAYFINNPVETIETSILGTMNMLKLAHDKSVSGFVYLSSMEVYGNPQKGSVIKEGDIAGFDTSQRRNSYPISKQLCESLCRAFFDEYGVPTKVARLTQTFGPGVEYTDNRVFAEFMRCVIEKRDIILHTAGKTERSYLYIADAVSAILTLLTKGKAGENYTIANRKSYCSISEMANMVASRIADNNIKVRIEVDNIERGYAKELFMLLDTSKIEALGWTAATNLEEMYIRMIESYLADRVND